jgi:hypothetical protein
MADDATPAPADVPTEPVSSPMPIEPAPSQIPTAPDPGLNSDTQKGMPPSSIPDTVDRGLESRVEADDGRQHRQSKNL